MTVSSTDVEHALLGLADALDAGIDVERSARVLPAPVGPALARAAREGHALTRALGDTGLLDDTERALLSAGEELGALPIFLRELVETRRARRALVRKTLAALAYPTLLVVLGSVVLPLPLLFSEGSDAYLARAWPTPVAVLVVGALLVVVGRAPRFRARVFPVVTRAARFVPLVRSVVDDGARAQFYRSLARLLSAGVSTTRALPLAFSTTPFEKKAGLASARSIAGGGDLSAALGAAGVFPDEERARVATHELSGTLDRGLQKLADDVGERASRRRTSLTVALTVVVMGLVFFTLARAILATAHEAIVAPMERALDVE